ncbi:uncharacterized protein LOC144125468 isoform X1 [Amblyomma americanum]
MSSERSNFTSTAPSSSNLEAAEGTERERAATAQDETLETNRSGARNAAELDLISLKERYSSAQDELRMLKTSAADLQTRCEKYQKTKDKIAARIKNLTARIREEKSSKFEKLITLEQRVQQLRNSLAQTVWTPEALDRMAEDLRAKIQKVEQECIDVGVVLEGKKAELLQVRMQGAGDVAAQEVFLEPEEEQMALQIFGGEGERLQRVLDQLKLKKQQLMEELDRLSQP